MSTENSTSNSDVAVDATAITAIAGVLEMLSAQLVDISKDVETSVDGVCSGFHGMALRAKEALAKASDSLDLSKDGVGLQAFVHRVHMLLNVLLHRIESSSEFANQLSTDLQSIDEQLELLFRFGDKLDSIGGKAREALDRLAKLNEKEGTSKLVISGLREQLKGLGHAAGNTSTAIQSVLRGLRASLASTSARAECKSLEDRNATAKSEATVCSILDQISESYDKMTESLSDSANMSRKLNMDIGSAVMSMQFQDRVNQRIQHLCETIEDLTNELGPYAEFADQEKTQSLTNFWMDRLAARSTMDAERTPLSQEQSESDEDSSIELF